MCSYEAVIRQISDAGFTPFTAIVHKQHAIQVADARVAELQHDGEDLGQRHVDLKRRFRLLYNGYKALRYKLEDEWPAGGGQPPSAIREEVVVTGSLEEILR